MTAKIRSATNDDAAGLADLILDVVAGGASVGFMNPLSRDRALDFCQQVLEQMARGQRLIVVAEDESGLIVGAVHAVLAMPDNQPHRADIAKMQVRRSVRRRGLGAALMEAIEQAAKAAGKSLLVLDTVTGSAAERLYLRLGWQRVGEIPNFALWPDGGYCSTTFYYKDLAGYAGTLELHGDSSIG